MTIGHGEEGKRLDKDHILNVSATSEFSPEIAVYYDEQLERWVGDMVTRKGVYRFDGPDRGSVQMDVENVLAREYLEWVRELNNERGRSLSLSRGGDAQAREKEHGRGSGIISSLILDSVLGGTLTTALSIIPTRHRERIHEFETYLGQRRHMATVAGVVVVASTRRRLKKRIIQQRGKHIQRIMNNVRRNWQQDMLRHQKELESRKKSGTKGRSYFSGRSIERKPSWEARARKHDPSASWQERVGTMRMSIADGRSRSQDLWQGR